MCKPRQQDDPIRDVWRRCGTDSSTPCRARPELSWAGGIGSSDDLRTLLRSSNFKTRNVRSCSLRVCGAQVLRAFAALGSLHLASRRKGGPQASQRALHAIALDCEVGIEQGLEQEPGEQ